jgi:hypothetical protein
MLAAGEDHGSVYFGNKAKMDPFAATPSMPLSLKYIAISSQLMNHMANNISYVVCKELTFFFSTT